MPTMRDSTSTPALSVVIASVNGYQPIAQCLESLTRQQGREQAEVIVVEGSGDDTAQRLRTAYPWATVIAPSSPRSIPELRSIGMRCARAAILVTTKDHCLFDPTWYQRILEAHRTHPHPAIGGAIENGSRTRWLDWAVYLCEYGRYMLPLSAGPQSHLPGPNVSYKREILEQTCGDLLDHGVWENVLHERFIAAGLQLWMDPSIVVYHVKAFRLGEFVTLRYHFGRSFAATRRTQVSLLSRLFLVVFSPFLLPLFLWRYAAQCCGKRRFIKAFFLSLPLLVLFAVAWSVGEFLGYSLGDGGSSLRVK